MNIRSITCWLLLGLWLGGMQPLQAQSHDDIQKQRAQNQRDIDKLNSMMKADQASVNNLAMINKQISNRTGMVNDIVAEIRLIDIETKMQQYNISDVEKRLKELTADYKDMLYRAFKRRNTFQKLLFILSSESFNQAYKRIKYMQQYTRYRQQQIKLIMQKKSELTSLLDRLAKQKQARETLLRKHQDELISLSNARGTKQKYISDLDNQKSNWKNEYYQVQRTSADIDLSAAALIAAQGIDLDPAAERLKNYKGLLPLPVEGGVVVREFGEQPHDFLEDVKVINNGIDIVVPHATQAKAVFDGTVTKIISIQGANKAVLVTHGNYFTLYSNLQDVAVNKGQKITAGTAVGVVYSDDQSHTGILRFQLWHRDKALNPREWLAF